MGPVSPINESPAAGSTNRRKAHRKSRKACAECRRRRVKCSESKPRCLACVRHDVACLYPNGPATSGAASRRDSSPTPAVDGAAAPASSKPAISDSPPAPTLPPEARRDGDPATWFSIHDMALLHHWTLSTSRTIVKSPHVNHCWQSIFPQIGFRQPFVMHGILSLSALHLAYTDPASREQCILDATRHHNMALQGFRDGIDRMVRGDYTDGDALFACSTLNIIYIFGILGRLHKTPDSDMRTRAARILGREWIPMIRGVGPVVRAVVERVRVGPLAQLLSLDHWEQLDPDRDPGLFDDSFRGIHAAWAASRDDAHIYDKAWYTYRKCFLFSRQFTAAGDDESWETWGYNRQWAGPLVFLHETPEEYFTRLHQRQPQALVIFSYFAAMLHGLDDHWFFEGWGRDIVEVIDQLLGDYWRPWTKWPRDVVRLDQPGASSP